VADRQRHRGNPRPDISGDGSTFPAPQRIGRFERGGQPQPVTMQPLITVAPQTLTDPTVGITLPPTRVDGYLEVGTHAGGPSRRVVRPARGFYVTISCVTDIGRRSISQAGGGRGT
jgi:hypothetical protein